MGLFENNGRREDRRPRHVRTAAQRAARMSTGELATWVGNVSAGLAEYAAGQAAGEKRWPQVQDAEVLVELVRVLEARATGG